MNEFSILEIVLKGMAIGFLAAAPTGPSGVLAIQRTLNKGRWNGFFTGLGVTVSDAVYIFVTMMCLKLVLGYLEDSRVAMTVRIAGCALLLIFGITTIRNNPLAKSRNVVVSKDSIGEFFATGFLVAIVNPLVVFIYMGLFAFFSLPVDDFSKSTRMLLYSFTILGDVCWWFTLSFIIDRVRNRFDLKGLWILNRILGTVLITVAIGWLVYLVFS